MWSYPSKESQWKNTNFDEKGLMHFIYESIRIDLCCNYYV